MSASIPSANGIKCFTPKLCDAPLFVTIAGEAEVAFGFFVVVLAAAVAFAFIELVVDIRIVTEVIVAIFDIDDVVFIFAIDVVLIFAIDVVLTFAMTLVHVRCVTGIVTVDVTVTVLTLCVLVRFVYILNVSGLKAYHRMRSSTVNHFERKKE